MLGLQRPEAVLFDLDGTLFDHEGAATAALQQWLPTVGLEASPEVLGRWFEAEETASVRWRSGEVSWQGQRRLRLRTLLPDRAEVADADLDALFTGYLGGYDAAWRAFDDVAPALDELAAAGLRLAVLTNGATVQQQAKLAAIGLRDRFEFVVTSEDLHVSKPDPMAFLTACDRCPYAAGQVVHVGDRPELDLAPARAAGLHAVLIDRSSREPQQADVLHALTDLPAWISQQAQSAAWIG